MKPLCEGDKVRVYGNSQVGSEVNGFIGYVDAIFPDGWINIRDAKESGGAYTVHAQQCRRLIKKKAPDLLNKQRGCTCTRSGASFHIFTEAQAAEQLTLKINGIENVWSGGVYITRCELIQFAHEVLQWAYQDMLKAKE